jgi:hypothetical protein
MPSALIAKLLGERARALAIHLRAAVGGSGVHSDG